MTKVNINGHNIEADIDTIRELIGVSKQIEKKTVYVKKSVKPKVSTYVPQDGRWWTEEEVKLVKDNYNGTRQSIEDLSKRLNRSYASVYGKIVTGLRLGCLIKRNNNKNKQWSKKDIRFVKENKKLGYKALGKRLGRTPKAIEQVLYKIKLGIM